MRLFLRSDVLVVDFFCLLIAVRNKQHSVLLPGNAVIQVFTEKEVARVKVRLIP